MQSSSASDNGAYPAFCVAAANDESLFATFRREPTYLQIVEHFGYDDGLTFLNSIKSRAPELLRNVDRFRTNDMHGSPVVYEYADLGELSPSTLRYICHLANILEHFPDLSGARVIEIGGGYGGLCDIVTSWVNIASYTLVDLPQAMLLQDAWLTHTMLAEQRKKVSFWNVLSGELPPNEEFDLVISNFAFTECTPAIQDAYLEEIARRSKAGFILYNVRPESYHPAVLISKLQRCVQSAVKSFPETPSTAATNFLLVYGSALEAHGSLPPYYVQRAIYRASPLLWTVAKKVRGTLRSFA